MRIKTLLAAFVLMAMPGFALADCPWSSQDVTMSCSEGTSWDPVAQACVNTATS